jgi:hypothetical protein
MKRRITKKEAEEYFIKLTCDSSSKDELAKIIWDKMDSFEREKYFRELEDSFE